MGIVIFIVGYALIVWLTAFWFGTRCGYDQMDEFEWVMSILWPLVLIILIVTGLSSFVRWTLKFIPGKEHLVKVAHYVSLAFQPYVVGQMFDKWRRARKDRKFLESKKEEAKADPEFSNLKGADCHGKY